MKIRALKIILAVLGLVALFAAGLAIRRVVLSAQYEQYGRPLPFNLESALEFRYVRMLFTAGHIPCLDKDVQVPEGIVVRETYTLGAEYVYALSSRLFSLMSSGRAPPLPLDERVRWIAAAWFCLGIPLMSLWLWAWTRSAWAAWIAGVYYAVSLAAVMRSTGQELQHENFALPLLIGHWALGALANKIGKANVERPTPNAECPMPNAEHRTLNTAFLVLSLLSALMLACAVSTWDLIQYYVVFWVMLSYIRFVAGRYFRDTRACLGWWLTLLALAGAGALNPYLRAHAFAGSYAMLLAYGVALGLGAERLFPFCRRLARLLIPLLPLIAGVLWIQTYNETYSHFTELLWAKLRFLNHKPADPALLTFDQRILWTAPLNSASLLLTAILFPVTLWLSLLAGVIAFFHARSHPDPEINQLLGYTVISLLAFVFFMRFHVFLILGFAALLGWLGYWVSVKRSFTRWLILVLLLAGAGVEAAHVFDNPARWGSVPVYLNEKRELCQWLRTNAAGERVLANFGLSPFLLTYANCPIVLHPKFESPGIRNRVRTYGEALFKSNEEGFRAWMEPFGAPYYVYALGEFADVQPESQMRYCVNALNPPPSAAARLFEQRPEQGRYFRFLWGNAKYRVFRVITRADELSAGRLAAEAAQALRHGRRPDAEDKATQALMYDPQNTNAMQVLLGLNTGH
ncbi:MAG: hypothetical protein PHW60_15220 [Kiritimatiellae bacterium]|nr:hypothetical protein [Kiritimatiellia bacterium]